MHEVAQTVSATVCGPGEGLPVIHPSAGFVIDTLPLSANFRHLPSLFSASAPTVQALAHTTTEDMVVDTAYLGMFVFLLLGACANLPFFVRSLIDCFAHRPLARAMPAAPPALLTTALAELLWVVPCLVQCGIQLFNGEGAWSPASSKIGCDIMGFYSTFASIGGMLSTLFVAALTFAWVSRGASLSGRASAAMGALILSVSLLVSALPFMGVGTFKYTGEGFCYFDWHSPALASVMLVITLPTMIATIGLFGKALSIGGWPSRLDLILAILAFLSAWTLWLPASVIGLAGGAFPSHYMISGGIMGHAQALLNPYIYGIRWRVSALKAGEQGKVQLGSGLERDVKTQEGQAGFWDP